MVGLDALIVRSWNNSDRLRLMGQASPNESPTLAELSDATGSSIGLAACFRSVIAKSPRALGRCIPRRARGDRAPRRSAVGRGPDYPVDAGCEPDQMASRAHHMVLRAVFAEALCIGLCRVRSA